MDQPRINKDICSGVIFIIIAGLFMLNALKLPMGTSVRMGPGYFPLVLCVLLAALGVLTILKGLRQATDPPTRAAWGGLILITAAVIAFGVLVAPLGFIPALAIAVMISLFASVHMTFKLGVALIVGIVTFCWAVFIRGIKLPWPILGPWLGGY